MKLLGAVLTGVVELALRGAQRRSSGGGGRARSEPRCRISSVVPLGLSKEPWKHRRELLFLPRVRGRVQGEGLQRR